MFDEETHWIEIQLIGEDDEGIAHMPCEITLADGRTLRRTTDAHGLVRVEAIHDPANCIVEFPTLDAEAWAAI
ncbi:hypothetical protein ENSA5_43100 [Enhygromyxa salina]|uniref:Uncharacterized protein n=2 Tax=Enhygromyxa salina TaxID=215803 RepID=A0A2S9XK79_9BACT|nr:hypothetical protein ENSA5_43100 [Enhygromyxa salina]